MRANQGSAARSTARSTARSADGSRSVPPVLILVRATALGLLVAGLTGAGVVTASGVAPSGTSGQGVVPSVINGAGGNVTCAEVPSSATLSSSDRVDVRGNGFAGSFPAGIDVTLANDKRSIGWTSTFPITAVIVKGSDAANVYVYAPPLSADTDLVAPLTSSGQAAGISNVTFCWDDDAPPVDLTALCRTAAVATGAGPIVSFAGPIGIVDGAVVASSVPDGFIVTFDAASDLVGFTAPFPVVAAAVEASDPVTHVFTPPSTIGSFPLSGNPGDGLVVLCGLDTEVTASISCAQVAADAELGPIVVLDGVVDPADLPAAIRKLELLEDAVVFETEVAVTAVVVTASPSALYAYTEPVLAGTVPVDVVGAENGRIELTFCVRFASATGGGSGGGSGTGPDPGATSVETLDATADDPTEIATGGGPSGRTTLALIGFVLLALTGSSTMLLWSRGG